MRLLLILTFILVAPAIAGFFAGRANTRWRLPWRVTAKVGVSMLFVLAGAMHFLGTDTMVAMLPEWVPRRIAIVYATGVLELLGAVGIWISRLERLAGAGLVLLLIGVFPANVYTALNHLPIAGHEDGWRYLLVRLPFEIFLIVWVWRATRGAGPRVTATTT